MVSLADVSRATRELVAGGWVIRCKTTGRVICEVWQRSVADKVNRAKYEAVPVLQHLQEINRPGTLAYKAARQ